MCKYHYWLLSLVIALVACGSDDETPVTDLETLVTSVTGVSVPADGGSYTINVTASRGEWTSFTDNEWISVSNQHTNQAQGTIDVVVSPNTSTTERQGIVTVASGQKRMQVTVRQEGTSLEPLPEVTDEPDNEIRTPEGYQLVWHDEFDEGSRPNDDEWWYETGHGQDGWGNNEIQNYVNGHNHPEVCSVQNGFLTIAARKVGSEVLSIRMNTSQAWQYGWFEARLKLPAGKGTWPAFWMMPKNFTSWPGDGEIDIMEEVGFNPNYVQSTIHCNKYNNGGTNIESAGRLVPTAQTEFHIYACEWTAQYLRFYIDGTPLLTYRNDGTGRNAWPFDAPFYLKLNLAWGGNWGGAQGIDESCLPATYQIDYVRVFQKE